MNATGGFRDGEVIDGRYEVRGVVAEGGIGTIYKAHDRQLDRQVAVKVISHIGGSSISPEISARLVREGQALSKLKHPGVIEVYSVGTLKDGRPFLVIEYIDGKSLAQTIVEHGAFDCRTAATICSQLAEALAHAHAHGVLHRDVKPQNVLMQQTETGFNARLVDFGLSSISDQLRQEQSRLTMTGEILGTPQYMAPEQCRGEKVDERADVYSLGLVFFELLTGTAAFDSENPAEAFHKQLNEPLPNLFRLDPSSRLPQLVQDILDKATAKNKAERYQSASEMAADLQVLSKQSGQVTFDSTRLKALKSDDVTRGSIAGRIGLSVLALSALCVCAFVVASRVSPGAVCMAVVQAVPAKQAIEVVSAVEKVQALVSGSKSALACRESIVDSQIVKLWSDEDRFALDYRTFMNSGPSVSDCLPLAMSLIQQGMRMVHVHRATSGVHPEIGSPNGLSSAALHYQDPHVDVGTVEPSQLVYLPIFCNVIDSIKSAKLLPMQWAEVYNYICKQSAYQNDLHSVRSEQAQQLLCKMWELMIISGINEAPMTSARAWEIAGPAENLCQYYSARKDPMLDKYLQVLDKMAEYNPSLKLAAQSFRKGVPRSGQ